jgi:hypothetical protein
MKINVKEGYNFEQPITVQVFEDEILMGCNHAGAEEEEVDFGSYENEDWAKTLVCDKCKKVENELGEWL